MKVIDDEHVGVDRLFAFQMRMIGMQVRVFVPYDFRIRCGPQPAGKPRAGERNGWRARTTFQRARSPGRASRREGRSAASTGATARIERRTPQAGPPRRPTGATGGIPTFVSLTSSGLGWRRRRGRLRLQTPRIRPRLSVRAADLVLHTGGHKTRPALIRILVFRRFSRLCGIGGGSPTLSATCPQRRKYPSKSSGSKTSGF